MRAIARPIRPVALAFAALAAPFLLVPAAQVRAATPAAKPAAPAALAASPAPAAAATHIDRAILDAPGRTPEDKAQDAGRKALDIYEWLGVKPGMTVADLFASGGYNTELLARVVGPKGTVYSVAEFYANKEKYDGKLYKVDEVQARIDKNNLKNVTLATHIADLPADGVEAMVMIRNYHDVEWVAPELKRKDVVAAIYRALKPGGVIAIEEVATDRPGWDKETHRLNEKVVVDDFTAGGFVLADRSNMLANPKDDHSTNGFKEGRHTMDRYLLKFKKPEARG